MVLVIEDNFKEAGTTLFKASDCFSDGECASDIAAFVCVVHSSIMIEVRGGEHVGIISQIQSFVKTFL